MLFLQIFCLFFPGSCTFHPGVPIFHDAMKGWSCCKKKSPDFTEFLNFPVRSACNVHDPVMSWTCNVTDPNMLWTCHVTDPNMSWTCMSMILSCRTIMLVLIVTLAYTRHENMKI